MEWIHLTMLRRGAERALAHVLVSTDAGLRVAESTGLPASLALIVHFDLPQRKVTAPAMLLCSLRSAFAHP